MQEIMFADITIGDYAEAEFTVSAADIEAFAEVSHDHNPIHVDEEFAAASFFGRRIAHGMLGASYISAVLGNQMPGPNTLYLGQSLKFLAPVFIGDELLVRVTVTDTREDKKILTLATDVWKNDGTRVISGMATAKKVR